MEKYGFTIIGNDVPHVGIYVPCAVASVSGTKEE